MFTPVNPLCLHHQEQEWMLNPVIRSARLGEEQLQAAAQSLGNAFVTHGGATETSFDRFYFLMQKYASTLPCSYGEEGVSLFRQWCMVTALMTITQGRILDELPPLSIIGVDLPGIQNMVYTITSRGAGKGVRGRSAFVQLLVSAVVDRLLDELGLCRANVIVNGGGNAIVLSTGGDELGEKLKTIEASINRILFDGGELRQQRGDDKQRFVGFKGDLALALAYEPLPPEALNYPAVTIENPHGGYESMWQQTERQLKEKMSIAKQQPFAVLMSGQPDEIEQSSQTLFETFFEPDVAQSDVFCAVCRRPQETGETFEEDPELAGTPLDPNIARCPECKGFEHLARALAREPIFLVRRATKPIRVVGWQRVLHGVSNHWYSIEKEPAADGLTFTFDVDAFPADNVDGFHLLATATPIKDDGSIRDNGELAEDVGSSLKRLGILKADVDDLAKLLATSLPNRSAVQTAMLSDSLALFFGGWLNQLCRQMGTKDNEESNTRIYILYAGGDDMLIIGSWDVMPYLAQHIASDFARFTGHNPGVHLSAGLVLVGGKEPLYAAVESADEELDKAKQKGFPNPEKNAITFLNQRHNWHDFGEIVTWQKQLVSMRKQGAPSSLLSTLLTIYAQYRQDRGEIYGVPARGQMGTYAANQEHIFLGPWLWKMLYRLNRLSGDSKQHSAQMHELRSALLKPDGIERMSISARWAQFLTRTGE